MYKNYNLPALYELYFNVSEAIEAELEEEEFGNGCNEIHLDDLYMKRDEIRAEILRKRHDV